MKYSVDDVWEDTPSNSTSKYSVDDVWGDIEKDTSITEDIKIGWGNVGKLVQDAAEVGVSGLMGLTEKLPGAPKDIAAQNLERFKNIQEAGKKTRTDIDTWANPEGKEQTFGGKAISVIGSLPGQIAAMPLSPYQTGKDFIDAGETVEAAQQAALIDTTGNVVGFGLPGAVGSGIVKKGLSGFGINAAQDAATRAGIVGISDTEEIKQKYSPTLETTALAGIVGGGIGALHGVGDRSNKDMESKNEDTVSPIVDENKHVDLGQAEIITKRKAEFEKQVEYAEYKIKELERDLQDPRNAQRTPEQAEQYKTAVIEQIVNHQKDIQALKQSIDNADALLRGEEPTAPKPTGEELPSSLPPRPEGEFIREEAAPVLPEQATQADMFDTMPPEPPRIDVDETSPEIGTQVAEEITIRPMESMDDIEFMTKDQLQERIDNLDITDPNAAQIGKRLGEAFQKLVAQEEKVKISGLTREEEAAVRQVIDEVGLNKDDITIRVGEEGQLPKEGAVGEAEAFGDSAFVRVTDEAGIRQFIENSPKLRSMFEGLPKDMQQSFIRTFTAMHEIGHVLLAKLIKHEIFADTMGFNKLLKDYDAYLEKHGRLQTGQEGGGTHYGDRQADYYSNFPEFFAERVATTFLLGDRAPQGAIKNFVSSIKKAWNRLIRMSGLKGFGSTNMVDEFIKSLIAKNKESLVETGKTMWEIHETKGSLEDGFAWQREQMKSPIYLAEKFGKDTVAMGAGPNLSNASLHIRDAQEVIKEQQAVPDIAPLGTGTMFKNMRGLINQGLNAFTRNWFGSPYVSQIYSGSPVIRHTSEVILASLAKQEQRAMELLSGVTDKAAWDAKRKRFFIPLQKIKDNLSLAVVAAKSSNADFHAVHNVFEQGIGRYSYEESLAKFGADLTPAQRTLFDTLSKMYGRMYKMAEGLEGELGKKKIIPNMKGWYPAVRKGDFAVSFHIPGLQAIGGRLPSGEAIMTDLVYRQQFFTREEAQAFIKHFESQSPEFRGRMQHNGIEEVGKTDLTDNMAEFMRALEAAKEQLALEEGRGGDIAGARQRLQRLQDQYVVRGGTLGAHHRLRTNVPGAAGNEMFKDIGSAGGAFRDANFSSVEEYTRLMMKMEIGQKLDLVLNDEGLKNTHPETMAVVQQMRDYALNDIKSPLEMKGFKRFIDKIYTDTYTNKSRVRKFLGAQKYRDTHLTDVMLGKMSHLFYIHALMLRPAFWAAQGSQFMWIARSLVKDGAGPVDAMTAAGKGFNTILRPDKDFLDGVFWQSQNTHIFAPQFINDLNKFHILDFLQEGTKGKLIVDLLTGEKQSTAADTFSRLMSYAMMHEHYKALGYTGEELWRAAGKATDENMVRYDRARKAPIFQKLGMVGDLISPLQTFSQAALGNLVADIGQMLKTPVGKGKLKASMPFMMTMTITSLMAGVIGAPLVMEYEALRLALNYFAEKLGLEARLPSVIDIVLSGDNDFSHRVLSHGLISSSTMAIDEEGFDIGASNRWQPIISGVITGEKTFLEAMPTINFVLQEAGYMIDMAGHITGVKELSEAEKRTAAMGVSPGMYKGVTNLMFGGTGDVVPTQKGDAFVENTTAEKAAKFLGTSTITASTERLRERRTKEEAMRRQAKVDKKYELMADALQKGDRERVRELAVDLATNYEQSSRQMQSRMKSEMFNRKVPSGRRQFVGKSGQMSNKQKLDYRRWQETYEDSPFDEEQMNENQ